MPRRLHLAALALLLPFAAPAEARILRLEVLRSEPAFAGQSFGTTGTYEHIFARAYGEIDPADPRNAIQDIELAPRTAAGMVTYSTDVELLRPTDMSRGNDMLLMEVNNRGNKLALGLFNGDAGASVAARNALAAPGDGFLMRQGYTLAWFGWEMDVRPGLNRLLMPPVIAHAHDGGPITGIVRSEIIAPAATPTLPIGMSQQVQWYPPDSYDSYPAASLATDADADGFRPMLTVRAREHDPRVVIPAGAWRFAICAKDQPEQPDARHLCYPAGFQPGQIYELIYKARDPMVLGLGFAATRDLGAFLRRAPRDDAGTPNPVFRAGQHAIIEGSSQSGRMIRSMIALGFNQDDQSGAAVFDGALPHIGGGLMPLNVRFGQPLRAWGEQVDHLYPAYDFPFTYGPLHDPLTGRMQGLLDRCTASATCPRIVHAATALEMWEGRQSLGLTDPLGRHDVAQPDNVRVYIMASTQHGAAPLPLPTAAPFGLCAQQPNPNPQLWTMRALLTDLTAWVRDGIAPPPSAVPQIADGTLVAPDRVDFPPIPANTYGGVARPALSTARVYDSLHVLDFGPLFRPADSSGIITVEPPRVGAASYGVLVPQVDADGNDLAGVRSVFLRVPVGTYTGWNLGRADRFPDGMCNLQGSFVPFAATRAERTAIGDPRPSLAERYPGTAGYVAAIRAAAADLVAQRFLLPDDAAALIAQAEHDGIRSGP